MIALPSAWLYRRFLSVQREFFLSSVAKCLMVAFTVLLLL